MSICFITVRIYIIGFRDKKCFDKFKLPKPSENKTNLADILKVDLPKKEVIKLPKDLFGNPIIPKNMSLSSKNGRNDYFLFNDLRNGATTIHSWDIVDTTQRQKEICLLLLSNRRKKKYGKLDGNPLSLKHFQSLDKFITQKELDELVELRIFKPEEYKYKITNVLSDDLTIEEQEILAQNKNDILIIDELKTNRNLKVKRIKVLQTIQNLKEKNAIECVEIRYDFKNTKISSGLFGLCRIFLPTSDVFPTLVASDTNDFVTLETLQAKDDKEYRAKFLEKVFSPKNYRKITKSEACEIQGFPSDFKLPNARARWMKLIGNSVSVPVIDILCKSIIKTGAFDKMIKHKKQTTANQSNIIYMV